MLNRINEHSLHSILITRAERLQKLKKDAPDKFAKIDALMMDTPAEAFCNITKVAAKVDAQNKKTRTALIVLNNATTDFEQYWNAGINKEDVRSKKSAVLRKAKDSFLQEWDMLIDESGSFKRLVKLQRDQQKFMSDIQQFSTQLSTIVEFERKINDSLLALISKHYAALEDIENEIGKLDEESLAILDRCDLTLKKSSKQLGEEAEQLGKEAEQLGKEAKQLGKEAKQLGNEAEQHEQNAKQLDKEAMQHNLNAIDYSIEIMKHTETLFRLEKEKIEILRDALQEEGHTHLAAIASDLAQGVKNDSLEVTKVSVSSSYSEKSSKSSSPVRSPNKSSAHVSLQPLPAASFDVKSNNGSSYQADQYNKLPNQLNKHGLQKQPAKSAVVLKDVEVVKDSACCTIM